MRPVQQFFTGKFLDIELNLFCLHKLKFAYQWIDLFLVNRRLIFESTYLVNWGNLLMDHNILFSIVCDGTRLEYCSLIRFQYLK